MNKQDLRIGILMYDSVRQKEVTLELKHFKELEIAETNFFERYQPLELSVELLERLGFVFDEFLDCFFIGKLQYFNYEYVCFKQKELDIEITKAHELQNIYFALTKTELKLK